MYFMPEKVAQDFTNLGHQNAQVRDQANLDLIAFKASAEAWSVSMTLLSTQTNQNLQFLGAQVLYLKIKGEFMTLQENEREEIKQFIFNTLNNCLTKYNSQTFKQICGSAAVIAIRTIPLNWEQFVEDMMRLADSSHENLFIVLEIFSNFHREYTAAHMQESTRTKLKEVLVASSDQLCDFFNIILEKVNDQTIVLKCLEAIDSLAQLQTLEILHYPKLMEMLLKNLNSEQSFELTIEALCEGIKNSRYADILAHHNFVSALKDMKTEVKASIEKLIEFIINDAYSKYLTQKDTHYSPYCQGITQLAAHTGTYFNIFVLENTNHAIALIKFLLVCTSHINKKISHITFDFWSMLKQNILKEDVLPVLKCNNFSFIIENYLELFKVVIEKCKLNSLKIISIQEARQTRIYNVDTEQEEDYDEDYNVIDMKKQSLSIREYRVAAEDVFFDCYSILEAVQGEEGVKSLFSLVLPLLSPDYAANAHIDLNNQQMRTDYILNCETVIFSIKFMLDSLDERKPHYYILEMMKNMINLPREDVLTRGVLAFLSEGVAQLRYLPELTDKVFEYCLHDLLNMNTIGAAAKCFQDIAETLGDKISMETLTSVACLLDNTIFLIENMEINERFILGIFRIAAKLQNAEIKVTYLQKIFSAAQEKFQSFTQYLQKNNASLSDDSSSIKKDALRLFKTLANVLKGYEMEFMQGRKFNADLLNNTALPFLINNIDYICAYFELFSSQPDFIGIFALLIKMSVKICGMKLEGSYAKILNLILQVFGQNPQKNSTLLITVGNLLLVFKESDAQKEWLLNNFSNLNNSLISHFTNHRDFDMLINWVDILENVFSLYPDFFLSLPEVEVVFELLASFFATAQDYTVQKKLGSSISLFLNKEHIFNPVVLKFLPKIVNSVFLALPISNNFILLSSIIAKILIGLSQQKDQVMELIFNALNQEQYQRVEEKNKKLFCETIFLYKTDAIPLSNLFQAFKGYAAGGALMSDSIASIENHFMRVNHSNTIEID